MARNKFQNYKKDVVSAYMKQAKSDFTSAIKEVNVELSDELKNMYRSLISDFYMYETTSYIRHFQYKPGTKKGDNLYYADKIRAVNSSKPKLIVELVHDDMADGYQHDTPESVLEYVLGGIRFPGYGQKMDWTTSYSGNYFEYSGTPKEIFDQLTDDFDEIAAEALYSKWKAFGYIL